MCLVSYTDGITSSGPVVVLPILFNGFHSRSDGPMTGARTSRGGLAGSVPGLLLLPASKGEQRVLVVAVVLFARLQRARQHLQAEPGVRPSSAGLVVLDGMGHAPIAGAFLRVDEVPDLFRAIDHLCREVREVGRHGMRQRPGRGQLDDLPLLGPLLLAGHEGL